MFGFIDMIGFDLALVSGLFGLLVGGTITMVGLWKVAENDGYDLQIGQSDGDRIITIGSYLTLISLLPLTVYATTNVFATTFQQFVTSFMIMGLFTVSQKARYAVQFPTAIVVSAVVQGTRMVVMAVWAVSRPLRARL